MPLSNRPLQIYKHDQLTPATVWTVEHYLGDYPVIDVFVMYDGVLQKIIPSEVTYVDANTCTITFTTAYAGYATAV